MNKTNNEPGKYNLIYADPCWSYDNKGTRAKADNHYPTMSLAELKRLPVDQLAADNCVLAMWWVGPMAKEARELAEAWGFKVRNMKLFTWVKMNTCAERNIEKMIRELKKKRRGVKASDVFRMIEAETRMGLGNYTRANTEDVLVAVKGNGIPRIAGNVKQVVHAPLGAHSAKPEEVRRRLEKLYGDTKRIELFSRGDDPLWHHWGNECQSNVIMTPATVMHDLTVL